MYILFRKRGFEIYFLHFSKCLRMLYVFFPENAKYQYLSCLWRPLCKKYCEEKLTPAVLHIKIHCDGIEHECA